MRSSRAADTLTGVEWELWVKLAIGVVAVFGLGCAWRAAVLAHRDGLRPHPDREGYMIPPDPKVQLAIRNWTISATASGLVGVLISLAL